MAVSDHCETDPAAKPTPSRVRVLTALDPFPAALLVLAVAIAAQPVLAGGTAGLGGVG